MKIALAHDFLNQLGGAEKTLQALGEIYPNAPIFTLFYDEEFVAKNFPQQKIISSYLQGWNFFKKHHKYFLPFLPKAVESLDLANFDLVLSNTSAWTKGILTRPETCHICYCHTPTRFLWDFKARYLEEQRLDPLRKMVVKAILKRIKNWDLQAKERVDFWIANSKNVQGRIEKYYNKKSVVIHPPVDTSKFIISPAFGGRNNTGERSADVQIERPSGDYFLIVSRLSPYKGVEMAVKAFNKLKLPLVIVGEGSQKDYLKSIAKGDIKFLGFQSDEEIRQYYSGCRAFIFPTFDEDFGITPIEAGASGRPVIAAGRGGTRESVVEGLTGFFFNEPTPESLTEAVEKFIENEKNFNPQKIREHALQFDIKVFKKKIKEFVEKSYREYHSTSKG